MQIKNIDYSDKEKWDEYIENHPDGTLYHLYGWRQVVQRTYGKKAHYLACINDREKISGILPLVHLKHPIFGNRLISIPYFDYGGILADDILSAHMLLKEAKKLATQVNASDIELRQQSQFIEKPDFQKSSPTISTIRAGNGADFSPKVRMILELPKGSENLFRSFKAKLRSQIKRPMKSGLFAKVGGIELLDDFYKVFCINMRDLGSPVHSKKMMQHVMEEFPSSARIVITYMDKLPIACGTVVGFKETLFNPWASSLKNYSKLAPNMLLYWTMLQFACENGYKKFDFGRSSLNENTFRFKKQWGAEPAPIYWYYLSPNGESTGRAGVEKSSFSTAIKIWRKMPVALTRIIGPAIRKNIGL